MIRIAMAGVACVAAALVALPAHAVEVHSTIDVSFVGLPVGSLTATTTVEEQSYSYEGVVRSNAMVSLVAGTNASFAASGSIDGRRVVPDRHESVYKGGGKGGVIEMDFAYGNLKTVRAVPVVRYKKDSVAVTRSHLRKVLDPASALIIPVLPDEVGDGEAVCGRVLPVFDGKTRVKIRLSHAGSYLASADGFSGTVHECKVRYVPVAGHRPRKKYVRYWAANEEISITLAQIGDAPVYGLFGFEAETPRGKVRGTASRFKAR